MSSSTRSSSENGSIDAASLLPHDESGHGFDNVNVGDLSPTHLDRYISAAQRISRLAVGSTQKAPQSDVIRVKPDVTQEEHVPGLPIGTRGGALVPYTFAQDGEYDIQIWLTRDRNEEVEGLALNRHLGRIPEDAGTMLEMAVGQGGSQRASLIGRAFASTIASPA